MSPILTSFLEINFNHQCGRSYFKEKLPAEEKTVESFPLLPLLVYPIVLDPF